MPAEADHRYESEGGAIRLLFDQIAGAANMIDCKFDMAVKNNSVGTVMIRWLPEMMCLDQSRAFGYPEGAVFNNTLVRRKRNPQKFIYEVGIPYSHPEAANMNIISEKSLPELAAFFKRIVDPSLQAGFSPPWIFLLDIASLVFQPAVEEKVVQNVLTVNCCDEFFISKTFDSKAY